MANTICKVIFHGTAEQEKQLHELTAKLSGERGALMPVLQGAQEIYGYLPEEVMVMIAKDMNVPIEEIFGVATFYSQFTLNPKGANKISVCLGTACYVKGSGAVFERLEERLKIKGGECTADGKFSLDACRCLGCCGLAPVMMINDEVYGKLTPDMVDEILAKYN